MCRCSKHGLQTVYGPWLQMIMHEFNQMHESNHMWPKDRALHSLPLYFLAISQATQHHPHTFPSKHQAKKAIHWWVCTELLCHGRPMAFTPHITHVQMWTNKDERAGVQCRKWSCCCRTLVTCNLLPHPLLTTAWTLHTSSCWNDLSGRMTRIGRVCSFPETVQFPISFALWENDKSEGSRYKDQSLLWTYSIAPPHHIFFLSIPLKYLNISEP